MKNRQRAFTLIELLVVISIIGLLTSIVLVSLQGTRDKARIARAKDFSATINHVIGAYAVGIWKFDEGSGNIANDSSGYSNNGTINGATFTNGISGSALSFNGTSDYVDLGNPASLQMLTNDFTTELWFKTNSSAGYPYIYYYRGHEMVIDVTGRYVYGYIRDTAGHADQVASTPIVTDNNWHHIALVVKRSTHTAYYVIDGVKQADYNLPTVTGNLLFNTNLGVGRAVSGGGPFLGLIDGFRIYNSALGITQIQKHYAEGLDRYQTFAKK